MRYLLIVAMLAGALTGCGIENGLRSYRGDIRGSGRIMGADNDVIGRWDLVLDAKGRWNGDIRIVMDRPPSSPYGTGIVR